MATRNSSAARNPAESRLPVAMWSVTCLRRFAGSASLSGTGDPYPWIRQFVGRLWSTVRRTGNVVRSAVEERLLRPKCQGVNVGF